MGAGVFSGAISTFNGYLMHINSLLKSHNVRGHQVLPSFWSSGEKETTFSMYIGYIHLSAVLRIHQELVWWCRDQQLPDKSQLIVLSKTSAPLFSR